MKSVSTLVASLAIAVLALAACGSEDKDDAGTAGTKPVERVKVLHVVATAADEHYVRELNAARKEAKRHPELDVTFAAGSGRFNGTDVIAKIENAVATGTKIVVTDCGGSCEQIVPALRKAIARDVKVVALGQPLPGLDGVSSWVRQNEVEGNKQVGAYLADQLGGKGEIAVIRCAIGNAVSDAREKGFKQGIAGTGLRVVARGDASCDPEKARTMMENMLTAHPNIVGVYSDTGLGASGAAQAPKAKAKDLVLVQGDSGSKAIVGMIRDGEVIDAGVVYSSEDFGITGMKFAALLAGDKAVPPVLMLPVRPLITKDNAGNVLAEIERTIKGG